MMEKWHTWREIHQQPQVWRDWFAGFDVSAVRTWVAAQDFDEIWFCGAGTSAYIGDIISAEAVSWGGAPIRSVATTDLVARPHAYVTGRKPLVVSFGRSGNSTETIGTLNVLDALAPHAPRLNITCNATSALATRISAGSQHVIVLPDATHDMGFAMTSSFSTMLLTALAVFDRKTDVASTAAKIAQTLSDLLPQFHDIANHRPSRVVYLGTGALGFAARESALKTLELTAGQIPSQWDTTLGFRHGPKSFVTDDTMIVIFMSPDPYARQYDHDLIAELQQQFPKSKILSIGVAGQFAYDIDAPAAWQAPIAIGLAQVQAAVWSHFLELNVDDPFVGRGTLSRVVAGVKLYEVSA